MAFGSNPQPIIQLSDKNNSISSSVSSSKAAPPKTMSSISSPIPNSQPSIGFFHQANNGPVSHGMSSDIRSGKSRQQQQQPPSSSSSQYYVNNSSSQREREPITTAKDNAPTAHKAHSNGSYMGPSLMQPSSAILQTPTPSKPSNLKVSSPNATPTPGSPSNPTSHLGKRSQPTTTEPILTRSHKLPLRSPNTPNNSPAKFLKPHSLPRLPEVPAFRPTEEEFKDPMKYIASIRDEAKKYGLARIIPPSDKWLQGRSFDKVVTSQDFIFQTKLQTISQLFKRTTPSELFLDELEDFLEKLGTPMRTVPVLEGQEVDMKRLYELVVEKGGFEEISKNKQAWKDLSRELGYLEESAPYIRHYYGKYLEQYEITQREKSKKKQETKNEEDKNNVDNPNDMPVPPLKKKKSSNSEEDEKSKDEEEFGYHDGRMFTLSSFKKMANSFKRKWFPDMDATPSQLIEKTYWDIVQGGGQEPVEVHYGSDLDVGVHGSGFPNEPAHLKKASGWNLNVFPKLPDSLLSYLPEMIQGVTVPMMYIGMLFSTFCWHTEDNHLYSINYLHQGAPKTWYGIPAYASAAFEEVMHKMVPELFAVQPDLLFLLITMLPPSTLIEHHVPVYHTIQQPGEFMITFPRAYHAGFSHGFNCAESCNFALEDWFPYGRESIDLYRRFARSSVFSFEKLLCHAAKNPHNKEVNMRLRKELPLMRDNEQRLRDKVLNGEGVWRAVHFDDYEREEVRECEVCSYDCYLSAIVCPCSPDKLVCLHHSKNFCDCKPSRKTLLYRYKMKEIDDLLKKVGISNAPLAEEMVTEDLYSSESLTSSPPVPHFLGRGRKTGGNLMSSVSGSRRLYLLSSFTEKNLDLTNCYSLTIKGTSSKKSQISVNGTGLVGVSKTTNVARRLARKGGVGKIGGVAYDISEADYPDEVMYILEKIVDYKIVKGEKHYLLKWKGFPSSENTWQKGSELTCPVLLEKFNKSRGIVTAPTIKKSPRANKGRRMMMGGMRR